MTDHLTCHSWMHPIWSPSHVYFWFVQIVSNSIFLFRCRNFVFPLSFLTSLSALISSKAIFFLDFCVCVLVILFNFFLGQPRSSFSILPSLQAQTAFFLAQPAPCYNYLSCKLGCTSPVLREGCEDQPALQDSLHVSAISHGILPNGGLKIPEPYLLKTTFVTLLLVHFLGSQMLVFHALKCLPFQTPPFHVYHFKL